MTTPDTTPLRVGVIGCGGISQMMHLPFLAERPDLFSIEALADVDPATLNAVGQRYGVPPKQRHNNHRDLLAQPGGYFSLLASDTGLSRILSRKSSGKGTSGSAHQ